VVAFYYRRIKQYAPAREFWRVEGSHMELIEHFQLGVADRELRRSIPAKRLKAGEALRSRLTQLGIYRASGHGHFNGSLVVPVRLSRWPSSFPGPTRSRSARTRSRLLLTM
jgi:hypothetical protein